MDPGWPSNPPLQVTLIFNSSFSKKVFWKRFCLSRWFAPCAGRSSPWKTGQMLSSSTSRPSTPFAATSISSSRSPCCNPSMLEGSYLEGNPPSPRKLFHLHFLSETRIPPPYGPRLQSLIWTQWWTRQGGEWMKNQTIGSLQRWTAAAAWWRTTGTRRGGGRCWTI